MFRIVLFLLTNIAVMLTLSIAAHVLGLTHYVTAQGLNFTALLGFCALMGFGGSFISLLISKSMAKWTTRARVIDGTEGSTEAWLVAAVREFAHKAGIAMPEVAIYDGAPNAFATGASKDSSLVAVSTGLLSAMDRKQVEAVLAHEVAHIANGDMVTMTLIQGVVNTFVMFAARVIGSVIDRVVLKNENEGKGIGFFATVFVLEILFGLLASMLVAWFSRTREFRADASAAQLQGSPDSMVSALRALGGLQTQKLPGQLAAFGIAGGAPRWFSSHPPIESRIAALQTA